MATINITGTGGIIEGNLGTANVNVNLDAALEFDGVNDLISVGNIGTHSQWTISFWCRKVGTGEDGLIDGNDASSTSFPYITANPANFYVYYDNGSGGASNTSFAIDMTVWNHFAITYDAAASNNLKTYCNGVLKTTVDANDGSAPTTFTDFTIGDNANYGKWDGFMADVKMFNDDLDIDDIKILASKINVDPVLVSKTANLTGWWKLNDGGSTINDFVNETNGGTDHNGTLTGGDWRYNEYCVDVYDNSTTTDGTFTVTQGKVEGLSLTSLDLDGSSDKITNTSFTMDHNGATFAIWLKKDNATGNEDTIIGQAGDANQHWLKIDTQGDIEFRDYPLSLRCVEAIRDTNWHHLAVTLNGDTNGAIYVDGVAQTLEFNEITTNPTFDQHGLRGTIDDFDGKMRDSKVFDYALSAEQVASLYSNTYPQTPEHNWKMNDGGLHPTGEPYVEDYGTGTDSDGIRTGATWSNGTLDLDGDFTIAANGTLSAPRGNLDLAGTNVKNLGAFTHNSGTVKFNITGNNIINNDDAANDTVFHNVISNTGGRCRFYNSITIENSLTHTSGTALQLDGSRNITLTMGTATSAGSIDITAGEFFRIYPSATTNTVTAANSLFPCVVTGADWSWSDGAGTINLSGLDFQYNITTGTNGSDNGTLKLTGDCEFDAVTVSSGDTLDLNGQRAEVSGILTIADGGTMNTTNGGLLVCGSNLIASGAIEDIDGTPLNVIVSSGTGHRYNLGQSGGGGPWCENLLVNGNVTHNTGNIGNPSSAHAPKNIIVGNGTFTQSGGNTTLQDFTIATGGTFPAGSQTVTCEGDFTTSGGLLGESCMDQSITATRGDAADALRISGDRTIEFWVKYPSSDRPSGGSTYNFVQKTSYGYYVALDENGKVKAGIQSGASTSVTSATAIDDNKWHHVAWVFDENTADTGHKIYIDGKLDAQATSGAGSTGEACTFTVGTGRANVYMDEVRLWDDVRTQTEIRANMFTEVTSGAIAVYNFNEGTGGTAADAIGSLDLTLSTTGEWPAAGTFTYGTSTLVMAKSGTQTINCLANSDVNNLTVNDGSTTQIHTINNTSGRLDVFGNFIINEKLKPHADSNTSGVTIKTADKTFSVGSDVKSTALAELYQIVIDHTGNTNIPECQIKILDLDNQSTVTATGNLTVTTELEVNSGTTFNANTNTINTKKLDTKSGSTTDLRNSNLTFKVTTSGDSMSIDPSSTILSGNTLVEGFSVSSPTTLSVNSTGGIEIVGDVKFLKMQSGGDLTVIGSVVGCQFDDTTGNIRQWHHTLDTQQLLDADEARDDDLRLTKPALDNALELMTK